MNSVFPIIKRFDDVKTSPSTVILTEEATIHRKCFRAGTIFFILGWREINDRLYLIINKGSWEGLVDYTEYVDILEKMTK